MHYTEGTRNGHGVGQWASKSINIAKGCSNNCHYCYAKAMNRRFRGDGDWESPEFNENGYNAAMRRRKPYSGNVMFPTSHDIAPDNLAEALDVILHTAGLITRGNHLLIVSKPNPTCITEICEQCTAVRDRILFRFSIGSTDDDILCYWEPGAPCFEERLHSLRIAYQAGYATSVSAEPLLDAKNVLLLILNLAPFVTDSIWIGKMRSIPSDATPHRRRELKRGQTEEAILEVIERTIEHPLVRYKDSYEEFLGNMPSELVEIYMKRLNENCQ